MKRSRKTWFRLVLAALCVTVASLAQASSALPKVLIIGDSISQGYTPHVTALLDGKAEVTRIPENGESSSYGVEQLDAWLGSTRWDVISFNFGLWDVCYRNAALPDGNDLDKVHGVISVSPEQYRRNLEAIVRRLERTHAHLIWENTTVIPEGDPGRKPQDAITYNRIAKEVMQAHGIAVVDLYGLTAGFGPELFKRPHNVHYSDAGYRDIAADVARAVEEALPRTSEHR
ncbi:SGNH/GDSL hydrolase family protein [Dyella kyungheensis]|uniref:SGNH/GDSL hydrolase family protein n=1 Tax=Dyella kyungheensis TaxID=1242174 RepID=UPI003CF06A1A